MKNYRSLTLILFATLFLGTSAFAAGMSGTYQVIQNDCAKYTLSEGQAVIVRATPKKLAVGVNYVRLGGAVYFHPAFDFEVGTVRKSCIGDCYHLQTGAYSSDELSFRETFQYARFHDSTPVPAGEILFELRGDELHINDGTNACLLKKLSSL